MNFAQSFNRHPVLQRSLLVLVVITVWLAQGAVPPGEAVKGQRVLVVHSYHPAFPFTDGQTWGMDAIFKAATNQVEPYVMYLDTKRVPPDGQLSLLARALQARFRDIPFEGILVTDNDALAFVVSNRASLFPSAPVVFSGVDGFQNTMLAGQTNITGVVEVTDYEATITAALRLRPQTRKVVGICDATTTGLAHQDALRGLQAKYQGHPEIEILRPMDGTVPEFLEKLRRLPADSAVLLLSHYMSESGRSLSHEESLDMILKACAVPVFVVNDMRLRPGVVGGKVVSGFEQGRTAAEMLMRLMRGAPVADVPMVTESPNLWLFDHSGLKRWQLPHSLLPPGSRVVNWPETLWSKYRTLMMSAIGIGCLLVVLIIALALSILQRHRAEAALRQSNRSFAAVFGGAGDALFLSDFGTGVILDVNSQAERLTGWSKSELVGRHQSSLHPDEGTKHFKKLVADVSRTPLTATEQAVVVARGGRMIPVEINSSIIEIAPGRTGLLGMFRDITERQRAEAALRESEERYRVVVQQTGQLVYDYDLATRRLRWAGAIEESTGYTPAEMEHIDQAGWSIHIHPEDRHRVMDQLAATDQSGERFQAEYRFGRKDGTFIEVEDNGIYLRDFQGRPIRMLGTMNNITERKRAGAALRESEARQRVLVEHAPDAILVYDADLDHWVDANPNAERLFGCDREALLASEPLRFYAPNQPDGLPPSVSKRQHAKRALAGEQVVAERIVENARGQRLTCELRLVRLPSAGRRLLRASYIDISERRRLEEQLRQAQKMEAVGQLAGGVAHDFNNILAASLLQLRLLLDDPALTPELRAALESLEAGSNRAASLTRQLLAFSRRQVLLVKPLDLRELLAHLLQMLRRVLGEHVDLVFTGATAPVWVEADAGMMEQVVMNLCLNARDAMPRGGRLTLDLQHVELAAAAANSEARPGRFVQLSVSDTGCGMDGPTLGRMFEPFFTTKEVGKGTGLGLATVYGIAKQHGGWIEVESRVGQGSSFRVFLPAAKPAPEPAAGAVGTQRPRGHETILLVEDDESLRQLAWVCLQQLGYEVLVAADGAEAERQWQEHHDKITLLLTDMVMPGGVSGLELAERLRQTRPTLPVIISSGYSLEMVRLAAPQQPDVAHLPKPYEIGTLARLVRACLDQAPTGP